MEGLPHNVREALQDLGQYLSDQIAPLVVADGMSVLIEYAPELTAAEIQQWTTVQYRSQLNKLPISDYLFHALKKIHTLGNLNLVEREELDAFLAKLIPLLAGFCPEADREFLLQNLAQLDHAELIGAPILDVVHRQMRAGGQEPAPAAAIPIAGGTPLAVAQVPLASMPTVAVRGDVPIADSRLVALMFDGLERVTKTKGVAAIPEEKLGAILATVANQATGTKGFSQGLTRLRSLGLGADTSNMFRLLGQNLPAWSLPTGESVGKDSFSAAAMRKIIDHATDAVEAGNRLHEMVKTAVAQFNDGSLSRAVTIYEIAETVIGEKKIRPQVVEALRHNGHEFLREERIREYALNPARHAQLRKVLGFYPALRPEGLLHSLETAERRDRRRFLLTLIAVHAEAGHTAALERLKTATEGMPLTQDWTFQRNLVHLLRHLPRPKGEPLEPEIELLALLADPSRPAPLLKEVIAALAQLRHERAEHVLIRLLARIEDLLMRGVPRPEDLPDVLALLDRVGVGLARSGPTGRRALVNHSLKRDPRMGQTTARLVELGSQDLTGDKVVVDRLLEALREELPRKVLGMLTKRKGAALPNLIAALAGSGHAPSVRQALQQVATDFGNDEIGLAARKALIPRESGPTLITPTASSDEDAELEPITSGAADAQAKSPNLAGDLSLFGLPNLLHSFAEIGATGILAVENEAKEPLLTVVLRRGSFLHASDARLQGLPALYQFLEQPVAATFTFHVKTEDELTVPQNATPQHVNSILLEGMRRHDELLRARLLVPDDAVFHAERQGTLPPGRFEPPVVATVWEKAARGATALDCEQAVSADSYVSRRLLLHWLEEGAIRPK